MEDLCARESEGSPAGATEWLERTAKVLGGEGSSAGMRALMVQLGGTLPRLRYQVVLGAAAAGGLQGWSCPALRRRLYPYCPDTLEAGKVFITTDAIVLEVNPATARLEQVVDLGDARQRQCEDAGAIFAPLQAAHLKRDGQGDRPRAMLVVPDASTTYQVLSEVLYTLRRSRTIRYQLSGAACTDPLSLKENFLLTPGWPSTGERRAGNPGETRLNLTVGVSYEGYIVAGEGGILTDPLGDIVSSGKYAYRGLNILIKDVKKHYPGSRRVALVADRNIPYSLFQRTMKILQGVPTESCTGDDGCRFDRLALVAPMPDDLVTVFKHKWAEYPKKSEGRAVATTGQGSAALRTVGKVSRLGVNVTGGTMELDSVVRTLRRGGDCIQARYKQALAREDTLQGEIRLCLLVDLRGLVKDVKVKQDTIGDRNLAQDVLDCMNALTFTPPDGEETEVCVPYALSLSP